MCEELPDLCGRCGFRMHWSAKRGEWYCDKCKNWKDFSFARDAHVCQAFGPDDNMLYVRSRGFWYCGGCDRRDEIVYEFDYPNEELVKDLRLHFEWAADSESPRPDREFHKHDQYVSYGLKTPELRRILKLFARRFGSLTLEKRLDAAQLLLAEHIGELGHVGIHLLEISADELTPAHFPTIDGLFANFRSWSHVDYLCGKVMAPLLKKYRTEILALHAEWSRSSLHWKRRASVVTFARKVGESGQYTDEVLQLCENLIHDDEDIVRKGVGWALKDNLRAAPERVTEYVKDLRRRGVSSTVTLYAIRDLKGKAREEVLNVGRES